MAHVALWKLSEVDELAKLAASAPVVAVGKIDAIPSNNMHQIRKALRGHATIRVAKNALIQRALQKAGGERAKLADLVGHIEGQAVLIVSDLSPFKLYKSLDKARSKAPAKAGQLAPEDILIHAGETPFKPGPIVGDLQKAGIPAKIDSGKVLISADKVLVKKGQPVSAELAAMLPRLDILPITVGLELRAAWEDGLIYRSSDLAIDETKVLADVMLAAAQAKELALQAAYPAHGLVEDLIAKAYREALAVALEAAFPDKGTIEKLVGRAFQAAAAVGTLAPDALSDADKALLAARSAAAPVAAPAAAAAGKKEEKKEEKVSEEEAAAGLGALFG